jgi:small ligand-binding sensory domain FIST
MPRFGDGLAVDRDLVRAAEDATSMALSRLDGQRPNLMAVFVCGDDPEAVAAALQRASEVSGAGSAIGCSAPGVIGSGQGVESTPAVAVWCAVLTGVRLRTFGLEVMPAEQGMAVIGMPERGPDDAVAVILADPWSFPVDGFVAQSNDALDGLPIVGGMQQVRAVVARPGCWSTARSSTVAQSELCSAVRSAPRLWSARAAGRSVRR